MKVLLGSDHGGYKVKEKLKLWLADQGVETEDVGNSVFDEDDDYVDFAKLAVEKMQGDDRAILFCRNGMGMCITANKRKGIRCGLGFGPEAVRKGRTDDDINALAIPADYCTDEGVKEMVRIFLKTESDGRERYQKRLEKISKLEEIW